MLDPISKSGPQFSKHHKRDENAFGSPHRLHDLRQPATEIRVTVLKPKESGFEFTPNWFGCYAWDPVNRVLYSSSMGNPVYRMALSP